MEPPTILNTVVIVLFGLCCAGIAYVVLTAPQRPRLAQVAFLVVAVFLLTNKVWSPQFSLWLVPWRCWHCRTGASCWTWMTIDALVWVPRMLFLYGEQNRGLPEQWFTVTVLLRDIAVIGLCALVIHQIYRSELDLVRNGARFDDPSGGVFDGRPTARPAGCRAAGGHEQATRSAFPNRSRRLFSTREAGHATGTGLISRCDGEQVPFARHALELVSAAIVELEPGPDHEVAQCAGHEHVVRPGQRAHPRADVHADSADVVAATCTRRCATRRAPRCRTPALSRGSTSRSGSLAAGRRTSRGNRLLTCSPRGRESETAAHGPGRACASSNACQSRSPISAA